MAELFRRSVYRHLMDEDENFSSWIENIARGSKIGAEATLRRMGRICMMFGVTSVAISATSSA